MRNAAIVAIVATSVALAANAAPFAVQVGESRIALDAPPGFADTAFTGSPRLQELGEMLTSASNRVLLFAISDADLRRFTLGDQLELRRYMIAVTPRVTERERMSESAFKAHAAELLSELEQAPTTPDYQKYLDSRPPGAVSALAGLRKEPDSVSLLYGSRTTKGGGLFSASRSQYLLSSTSVVLLRGKPVNLSVYTQYEDAADLEWIRVATVRWIEELKRLNSR